jgi:NAD dependent epimerase/dehydratase family enzyme
MRVAVSGSTGLVGSQVVAVLSAAGHEVVRLVRRPPAPGEKSVRWDPEKGEIDAAGLESLDAVVHLAGENVGSGRWTAARKAAIRDSRVNGTRFSATLSRGSSDRRRRSCAPPRSAITETGERKG